MRILIALAVILSARAADAGVCLGEEEFDEYLGQLEAAARSPAKGKDLSEHWGYCLQNNQKRKARIVKACTAIAARLDASASRPDTEQFFEANQVYSRTSQCIQVLAAFGVNPIKTKTKDVDWVGDQLAKKYPAHEDPSWTFTALEQSGDPRVVSKVAAMYREHLEAAAKKPPQGWRAQNWIRWHRAALSIIEKLGGTDELQLLDLAKSTKDARVKTWAENAQRAIAKRSP